MTGRQEGENSSRLCKRKFFTRFMSLIERLPSMTEVDPGAAKHLSYGEVKALSNKYQVRS